MTACRENFQHEFDIATLFLLDLSGYVYGLDHQPERFDSIAGKL